ncbi:hypothetical protein HANVADRAFT_62211 [Hanseniaspora valbyensis NRRL Y-1626]|uniref:OBG-type G domain-containing protein n=1 Tax=Hanseniaspora valbyensis NRRL Y-1626 TaxID=766949 RepID=A0A1B7TEM5_9ASCO|nr:hypothetical protein HANVADRAFT_62211 [Hanseniaspora valbyensis NRRL Y-1626]
MQLTWKDIPTVPNSNDMLDIVLNRTQRKTPTIVRPGFKIQRIRAFYLRKVKFTSEGFIEKIDDIILKFPKIDDLHPFHKDLMDTLYEKNHYKISLASVSKAKTLIEQVERDYCRLLKFGQSLFQCKQLKRAALGRMATIVKKLKDPLVYLEQVRQHLGRLPMIDPNTRTLVICGYPNVGKSSFLRKITKADVEVQPYAFTTKSLFVGHFDYKHLRFQAIDTPGILDRPTEEMNNIEMQSIYAIAHLRSCILYFMDLSEQCGFSIEAQVKLFHNIKPLFQNKSVLVVLNKSDIIRMEHLDQANIDLINSVKQMDGVEMIETSCINDEDLLAGKNGNGNGDVHWRWLFLILVILNCIGLGITIIILPETCRSLVGNGDPIWAIGLKKLNTLTPEETKLFFRTRMKIHLGGILKPISESSKFLELYEKPPTISLRNYIKVLKMKYILLVSVSVGLQFSLYYAFVVTLSHELKDNYGFKNMGMAAGYVVPGSGLIIGTLTSGRISDKFMKKWIKEDKVIYPEKRLIFQLIGIYTSCIGGIMYGWFLQFHVSVVAVFISSFFVGIGLTWATNSSTTYASLIAKAQTGTAVSIMNAIRNAGAAISSGIAYILINKMGCGWFFTGLSLLVAISTVSVLYVMNQSYKKCLTKELEKAHIDKKLSDNISVSTINLNNSDNKEEKEQKSNNIKHNKLKTMPLRNQSKTSSITPSNDRLV